MKEMKEITIKRECDGCNVCCEGWLHGEVYGYKFWQGTPCHFKTATGCKIYEDRPENPCRTFLCGWRGDLTGLFPEWLKPNLSKVIIAVYKRRTADNNYFQISEAGQNMDSRVLSWVHLNLAMKGHQVAIQVHGGWVYYGPPDFIEEMMPKTDSNDLFLPRAPAIPVSRISSHGQGSGSEPMA